MNDLKLLSMFPLHEISSKVRQQSVSFSKGSKLVQPRRGTICDMPLYSQFCITDIIIDAVMLLCYAHKGYTKEKIK